MKIIIFDSGTLINFSMNGLVSLLADLKKKFKGKFIMPKEVKFETLDKPLKIKRFMLGALKIKSLIQDKVMEMPESIGITEKQITEKKREILKRANNSFFARGEFMHIIDDGEASCLALSLLAGEKGIDNVIAVDERTTRMIIENPENLRKLFEDKLRTRVDLKDDFSFLEGIKVIRSTELVYVAYKKNLVEMKNGILEALLYATKYKGCSISEQEIQQAKQM